MDLIEREENFKKNMGEILRVALNIESFLDFFITTYFMGPSQGDIPFENQTGKRAFFQESIAFNLKFGVKKQILKGICEKKFEPAKTKELIEDIEFISNLRNKVAHDDMRRTNEEGPYLVKRDSLAPYDYKIFLTDELMKDVQRRWVSITTNISHLVQIV